MMDRFKFRVWDKLDEQYYDENCFQMQIESSGDLFIIGVGNDGEDCFWETDNTVVEQCTGIKDKNGKLIYEGDIVRSESYPFKREEEGTYNYAAEICFDKDSAVFFYWIFRTSSRVAGRSEGNTGQLDEYEWEVIGNIHENKELLDD